MTAHGKAAPGYKQTKIGAIPADWDLVPLGKLFDFKNGINKSKKYFGYGTPIVNYMDVFQNPGLLPRDVMGRVDVTRDEKNSYEVKKGDVFFTRTSETVEEIGIASVLLESLPDAVFSGFILRARPTDDSLDNNFKKYCFSTYSFRRQVVARASYTTRALTNGRALAVALIARPPIREQQAIADALSDADALIGSIDSLIAKKRDLKHAAMQCLLTGKSRLAGFKGKWVKSVIGAHADLFAGGTPSTRTSSYWGGSIPWMSSGELHQKSIKEVRGRITELGLANSAATWIPLGSILVGLAGQGKTRGTVAINRIRLTTNQSIAAIVTNNSIDAEFLYHNLDNRYGELRELSSGDGGRGGLNLNILGKLDLYMPLAKDEQAAIALTLSDMDVEIGALEAQRDKARSSKQGMMQELLTGRIRLA